MTQLINKLKRCDFFILWMMLILFSLIGFSCKKDWLDAKPDKSLAVPGTIRDYQALLSSTLGDVPSFNDSYGMLAEIASGDFYVTNANFNSTNASLMIRNVYSWASDFYGGGTNYAEWNFPYKQIYYTNIVLEGIKNVIPKNNGEQQEWNQVKATALFFRAFTHYDIARQFCKPYVKSTASSDLGIPLRLESDFNVRSVRSTVEQTYNQILGDLKESIPLLQISTPINIIYKCQPNKAAAYAMLARVYLAMSNYDSAFVYADKSLNLYNTLIDYNTVPSGTTSSFQPFNSEILFNKRGTLWFFLNTSSIIVDSFLYQMFDPNDRRLGVTLLKNAAGLVRFTGSYDGQTNQKFAGLATDEVLLVRAECHARLGRKTESLIDLDALLIKRMKTGFFVPSIATDANDALKKILIERRKELCFRSLRWEDLRRLNLDPQFAVTLKRVINGQTYTLSPNSNLYVFPIPDEVIRLTGMQQNPR